MNGLLEANGPFYSFSRACPVNEDPISRDQEDKTCRLYSSRGAASGGST